MYKLPKNLIYLLKRFDTTQAELASYVEVSQNSISNWINEVSQPNAQDLMRINQYFGISIDALIFENLENGKVVSDQHVNDFKLNGKVSGKVMGKVPAVSREYFNRGSEAQNTLSEPDSSLMYIMMGQFTIIREKIDQVQVSLNQLPEKVGKK